MNIQTCKSSSEFVPLYLPQNLFLKPLARLNISIQLPSSKATGKTISNWELMERMRDIIQPETFSSLKAVKSSSESIRFEGEIEDKRKLNKVIDSLNDRSVKLNGYPEFLKLKASEVKLDFPTRHTWDSFFRDASNMDEMKHGERPDTVHIANLPIKWFVSPRDVSDDDAKPSENIFKKVFERFGKIRCVDIPICDPYRKQMKAHMTGISTFSFDSELYFEGYVQYSEYMGFVRAMDAFRGMKVVKKLADGTGQTVTVRVDFDKTKHLSDASIKRRSIVRERLVGQERAKEEKGKEESLKQQKRDEAERRKLAQSEMDKLSHTQEREERRKAKQLAKLKEKESKEINSKIAEEQKKLVKTQRKLQSIRLIEELFRRIQLKHKPSVGHKRDDPYNIQNRRDKDNKKELKKIEKALLLENKEKWVREKLVKKYKSAQEQELEEQRCKLKKALEGNIVLRSALDTGKKRERTPSISSLSSGSDICLQDFPDKKIKTERMTSPERHPFIKKEGELMMPGYSGQVPQYNYSPYPPYINPSYNYPHQMGNYFPRGGYYPPGGHQEQGAPPPYNSRGRGGFISRRGRGGVYNANHNQHLHRGGYRGGPRMPFFDGPNANHAYYKYFKKLAEGQTGDYLDRERSYSRSRSRSRRRSYSRSRSRSSSRSRSRRRSSSRRRSRYSRSRSGHSRSRSRNRRTRTRSRSRSRSRRSRSRSRNRSKSRSKSRRRRSHSKRSQSREKSLQPESKKSTDFIPRAVRENTDRPKTDSQDRHTSNDKNPSMIESREDHVQKSPTNDKRESPKSWSPQGHDSRKRDAWSESPSHKK